MPLWHNEPEQRLTCIAHQHLCEHQTCQMFWTNFYPPHHFLPQSVQSYHWIGFSLPSMQVLQISCWKFRSGHWFWCFDARFWGENKIQQYWPLGNCLWWYSTVPHNGCNACQCPWSHLLGNYTIPHAPQQCLSHSLALYCIHPAFLLLFLSVIPPVWVESLPSPTSPLPGVPIPCSLTPQ